MCQSCDRHNTQGGAIVGDGMYVTLDDVREYLLRRGVGDSVGEIVKFFYRFLYSILIQVETAERVHNTRERAKTHTLTLYLMLGLGGFGVCPLVGLRLSNLVKSCPSVSAFNTNSLPTSQRMYC